MKFCDMLKRYEQRLLDRLHSDSEPESILSDVRKSMGAVSYAKGNPLTKTEICINVDVSFFQFGVGGGIILPAALPVALQNFTPIYLFGLTDLYGGYFKMSTLYPPGFGWNFGITPFVIIGYTGLVPGGVGFGITNFGDLIYVLVNNPVTHAAAIRISCNNVAYGTFLNSFVSDLITVNTMRYVVPIANINQFVNPLFFNYQTLFGKITTNSVDPRMYITSKDFQQQVCDIPIKLPIDKRLGVAFNLDIFCQHISFILFVEKVEPLTHKKHY